MESLAGVCAAPVAGETVDVVFEVGALDKYFCFISSVVNDAPVLRIPDPPELSEPVLESDEALLVAGVWVSVEVLLRATIFQLTTSSSQRTRWSTVHSHTAIRAAGIPVHRGSAFVPTWTN